MEEALRTLDATRAALQEEYDAIFVVKVYLWSFQKPIV